MSKKTKRWLIILIPFLLNCFLIYCIVDDIQATDAALKAEAISRKLVNWNEFAISLFCFYYYFVCGRKAGFNQSALKIWLILGTVLLFRGVLVHISIKVLGASSMPPWLYFLFHGICLSVFLLLIAVETAVVVNCFKKCPEHVPCLIVLGAKTGSNVLNARVDAAETYMERNTETVAVCSGGQGKNEPESEASYMCRRLTEAGIAPERMIPEDRSRTTAENLRNSAPLIPDPQKALAVVTDDYHIFRARCIARRELGRKVYGLPSRSSLITLPHYMLREFLSSVKNFLLGLIMMF